MESKRNQFQHELKQALRAALQAHGGDPNQRTVGAAIDRLMKQNPTSAPARQTTLLEGDWLLTSAPSFPNGEMQPDGSYVYTLGRLAFNMFEPRDLKVVINQVSQPVFPIQGTGQHTHDIVVKFTVLDETVPPLQGIVRMKRSPKGSLEILYLDEDLRITKGEKGTVLVCEKRYTN